MGLSGSGKGLLDLRPGFSFYRVAAHSDAAVSDGEGVSHRGPGDHGRENIFSRLRGASLDGSAVITYLGAWFCNY